MDDSLIAALACGVTLSIVTLLLCLRAGRSACDQPMAMLSRKRRLVLALSSVTRGVGTTLYMSPEQRAGKPYDHKVDIYSAGVLLLEMFHPFDTQMERFHVLMNLQRHVLPKAMVGTPEVSVLVPTHAHDA